MTRKPSIVAAFIGDKVDRYDWEIEENESGDTQYLEREWSALEIEDMIDEAAEEAVPVDMFIRRRVV